MQCVQTCIGINIIEPLNHEGWFEEVYGIRGEVKNGHSICIPHRFSDSFLLEPDPKVAGLYFRQLVEVVNKQPECLNI